MPAISRLGQNFLRDSSAVERIVGALGNLQGRTVVEIGPGMGAITGALAARAGRVVAVEVDHELALHLRAKFPSERVLVVEQDILAFDFDKVAQAAGSKLLVAGNLPYYITSPILLKLTENHACLERAVLMVQREVAERVAAEPGTRDYGSLTVAAQLFGPVEVLFTLPPEAFSPPPKVHSSVFRWSFAPRMAELGVDEAGMMRLTRQVFAQKRKTLANNLRAAGYSPEATAAALELARIPAQARAEALSLETLATLYRALHKEKAAPELRSGL